MTNPKQKPQDKSAAGFMGRVKRTGKKPTETVVTVTGKDGGTFTASHGTEHYFLVTPTSKKHGKVSGAGRVVRGEIVSKSVTYKHTGLNFKKSRPRAGTQDDRQLFKALMEWDHRPEQARHDAVLSGAHAAARRAESTIAESNALTARIEKRLAKYR